MTLESEITKSSDDSVETYSTPETDISEPNIPQTMTEDVANSLETEADGLIEALVEVSGAAELEATDTISNVGLATERRAAGEMRHLKARVSDYMKDGGSGKDIASGLTDLRQSLDQLNPHNRDNMPRWERIASRIPLLYGQRGPIKRLQRIAMQYEPVSVQIDRIETNLRTGRNMLVRDNVELRKLYEQIHEQQTQVRHATYFCELVASKISKRSNELEDKSKIIQLEEALVEVKGRIADLKTMEAVHDQYFVSIHLSRQNNKRLGQAVERTLSLATNVVMVGLAIQSALARQNSVTEATENTREFLGNVITASAREVRRHTEEIGDLYSSPVIALDKISQAQDDLIAALDSAEKLRHEGLSKADENIRELGRIVDEFETHVGGTIGESALPTPDQTAAISGRSIENDDSTIGRD